MTCSPRSPSDRCKLAIDMTQRGFPPEKVRRFAQDDGVVRTWKHLLPPDTLDIECQGDCPLKEAKA
jgi:hypothetical protein